MPAFSTRDQVRKDLEDGGPSRRSRHLGGRVLRYSVGPAVAGVLLLTAVAGPGTPAGTVELEGAASPMNIGRNRLLRKTTTTTATSSTSPTTAAPTTTVPTTAPSYFAGFETGDFSEVGMNQSNNGSTALNSNQIATGAWSAKATVSGGVSNQFARVGQPGPWNVGTNVVYKASFLFPAGFFANMTNQMDLMRIDNWDDRPTAAEYTGLTINLSGTGRQLYLFRNQLGTGGQGITYLAGPYPLPTEGVWHNLEVRQTLSPVAGSASNALYVDGILQGSSTGANMFGATGNRYNWLRAGIVSSGVTQTTPISLFLDNLSVTRP